ncbi:uncharacterized protein LOC121426193 isoform X2 [Lytechinus variegatus]|uniref:uncharacterized protein LOC121426193 isoform X2 n=1 Tax=Lytechinus variegatus TaxID=7654 RepID=UPI001BB1DF0C|nr:uncharacterized protein LOC121426193 isoform X2 [Lytechinus variegatus]
MISRVLEEYYTPGWNDEPALNTDQDSNLYTINPCFGFSIPDTVCQDVTVCRKNREDISVNIAAASSSQMYYSESDKGVILEYNHTDPNDPGSTYISRFLAACNGEVESQIVVKGIVSPTANPVVHSFLLLLPCAPPVVPISSTGPPIVSPHPIKTIGSTTPPGTVTLHPIKTQSTPVTHVTIRPPPSPTHHMSAGGVICLIFVCFVCGYFLIGSFYMFCCSGARGIEIIPNIHFWLDLPNLIMDGFFFLFGCCGNTQMVTSPSSGTDYDKI